jgi:hypothetical protein
MPKLNKLARRLELLEKRITGSLSKPALIKFYGLNESPTRRDIIEINKAKQSKRLILCFYATNQGIDPNEI